MLQKLQGITVMGPEYPLIARLQTLYIQELLLKIPRTQSLEQIRNFVTQVIQNVAAQANFKSVQFICNVDPY